MAVLARRLAGLTFLIGLGVAILSAAAPAGTAIAHVSTGGSIAVEVNDRRVTVNGPVPFADLGYSDTSGDGLIDATELSDQEADIAPNLVDAVRDHIGLIIDGEESMIVGAGVASIGDAVTDADGAESSAFVTVSLASGPHDGDVSEVEVAWRFDSPSTEVLLAHPDGEAAGEIGDDGTVSFSLGGSSSTSSSFGLGIDVVQTAVIFVVIGGAWLASIPNTPIAER